MLSVIGISHLLCVASVAGVLHIAAWIGPGALRVPILLLPLQHLLLPPLLLLCAGWSRNVTVEAFVVNVKDAAAPDVAGLVNPLLNRSAELQRLWSDSYNNSHRNCGRALLCRLQRHQALMQPLQCSLHQGSGQGGTAYLAAILSSSSACTVVGEGCFRRCTVLSHWMLRRLAAVLTVFVADLLLQVQRRRLPLQCVWPPCCSGKFCSTLYSVCNRVYCNRVYCHVRCK